MEKKVTKQSSFHQTQANQAKLGAYYTDLRHCEMIAELLDFPEGEEVACLEPSIGDANAIITVTKRKENPKICIFGVELDRDAALTVMENPYVEDCIHGDFLTDIIVTAKAFSFCFANPPYGDSSDGRLEIRFLKKVTKYLADDAVLVYVIPQYVAESKEFLSYWCSNYDTECCYRFHDSEYQKWRQVVFIGRRIEPKEQADMELLRNKLKQEEQIELLPEHYDGERIKVNPSNNGAVKEFQKVDFDVEKGRLYIRRSVLRNVVQEKTVVPPYTNDALLKPPIMPNAGQMYLMAISGAGQGLVGTEDEMDLHLQRGSVKVVEENEIQKDEEGRLVEIVKKVNRIQFRIVENDGTIHEL